MTVSYDQFIKDYPEFGPAPASVPQAQAAFALWNDIATLLLNKRIWPSIPSATTGLSIYDRGVELYIAHNLALEKRAQLEAAKGAPPGDARGAIASKSVGPVSVSYDTAGSTEADAGHWNLTIYGQRYIRMLRSVAAMPIQVNVGVSPGPNQGPYSYSGSWPGPWPYPEQGGTGFTS